MSCRFTLPFLFCCAVAFGQQPDSRLRLGVQLSAVFSRLDENGIAPMLTLDYRRFSLAAGPRFSYNGSLVMDANLRYFPIDSWTNVRPFVQIAVEYVYYYSDYKSYYDSSGFYSYGPIFDHSFNGRWESKSVSFNLYGGLGAEVPLWKALYVVASGGVGVGFLQWENTVINTTSGETEYEDGEDWHYRGVSWMASVGCGYRF